MKKLTIMELQKITQQIQHEIFPSCLPYDVQERIIELVNLLYLQAAYRAEKESC